jgi:hypothetical protein
LPSIKQSPQQEGDKNVQDERTQISTNKKSFQEGRSLEEHEQIKYLNPPIMRSISNNKKRTLEKSHSKL